MKRCAPPLSVISYQLSVIGEGKGLQRESRRDEAVINPSGLRTRTKVSRGSQMRGHDRSEPRFNFTRRVIERLLEISQNSSQQMRNAFSTILLILFVGQLSFGLSVAQAGPLDFFRRVRDSIAHPRHHERTPSKTQSKGDNGTTVKRNDVRPPELKEPEATETPEPVTTRTSSSVPAQRTRTDFPYGVPVPNKPGFVISPYSPNAGYVDIRGFPTGAEVKDPYTGKVFITP